MVADRSARRGFLVATAAGALLAACRREGRTEAQPTTPTAAPEIGAPGEQVGAVEDLMREHGVIRRVLVVYRVAAARLRAKSSVVPPDALERAARLVRTFAEDYHERQLEEMHLFPAVRRAGGAAGAAIETLVLQHNRGREITDYLLATAPKGFGRAGDADRFARVLEGFAAMYEEHAAQEDTVVFPAWKKALTPAQLDEAGELFEEIEHRTFGADGFDDAVAQVTSIEERLGIELGAMTAPPPPRA
jgi:hemerythrin-like domain-containing protein